jgi:hypothetical protein
MNRDYLIEKENAYWFGVLQGNYAEEINIRDPLITYNNNNPLMTTEFWDRFKPINITADKTNIK